MRPLLSWHVPSPKGTVRRLECGRAQHVASQNCVSWLPGLTDTN